MEGIFVQRVEDEPFHNIRDGTKKMEIRLNDEKRRGIKLGQQIKLINKDSESHFLFAKVIGLSGFANFEDLYSILGDRIKSYEREVLERVYLNEKVRKYGILVIHFELI